MAVGFLREQSSTGMSGRRSFRMGIMALIDERCLTRVAPLHF